MPVYCRSAEASTFLCVDLHVAHKIYAVSLVSADELANLYCVLLLFQAFRLDDQFGNSAMTISSHGVVSFDYKRNSSRPLQRGERQMGTRVGVGTGAPLHELHVVGQTYIDGRLVLRGSRGVNDTGFSMLPRDEKSMHFLYPEFSRWSLAWDPTAGMTAVQNEALQALNQTMYLMPVFPRDPAIFRSSRYIPIYIL